jgi:EpsD family peptidyl-prolyl cis-trans isomerase
MAHRLGWHFPSGSLAAVSAALVVAAMLSGCGDKKEKAATQSAVRVNKEEITVHQINAVLAQQRNLKQEQSDAAARQVLEQLIDQELSVQKAAELKLDRDARTVQAIEAARRDIIARAYVEKIGEGAPSPSSAEIKDYYDKHPELFKDRRVYQLQEIAVEASPDQLAALQAKLSAVKSPNEVIEHLKAANLKFTANQAVRGAEQIPMAALPRLAQMKDGQTLVDPTPSGANILLLVASRTQPVSEEQAAKPIEAFLMNERKRKMIADDLKALRASAKIEYLGKYAGTAPAVEATRAPTAADMAASAAAAVDVKSINEGLGLKAGAAAASAVAMADAAVKASSGVDAATLRKGLGLK